MTPLALGLASGILVGFLLGLVGGGGSILAVPLLAQVVGVSSPHVAIGTSAVAVTVAALANLVVQARRGAVKWRCALLFSASGVLGAAFGAALGKSLEGEKLLALFGVLMLGVGAALLRPRRDEGHPQVRLTFASARKLGPPLLLSGLTTGVVSGFFGIGGGFLIVPALLLSTKMPLAMAVASSLVAIAALGATTAASYASSGLVDWPLAAAFIAGGVVGGALGIRALGRLASHQRALSLVFALIVIAVGLSLIARGFGEMFG